VHVHESISCARIVSIVRRSTVARIRDPSAPEQRAWLSQHLWPDDQLPTSSWMASSQQRSNPFPQLKTKYHLKNKYRVIRIEIDIQNSN
jgi:hypothetical protein